MAILRSFTGPATQTRNEESLTLAATEQTSMRKKLEGIADPVALLEGMFAHSPVPYIVFKADGHPLLNNSAYRQMFGSEPPSEYCLFQDEVSERTGLAEMVRRAFRGETVQTPTVWYDPKEMKHITVTDAKRVAISCTLFPLRGNRGEVTHVAVAFKDVTAEYEARERAEAERDQLKNVIEQKGELAQALRENEDRLRQTLDAAEVGTWEWNISTNRVQWSPNIERIFGLPSGTFAGTYEAWLELVHPDDREMISGKVTEALENRGHYEVEFRFVRPDGTAGWQSGRGYVVVDHAGNPKLLRGVVFDVTERKLAQETTRENQRRMEAILAALSEGILLQDEMGQVVFVNDAAPRLLGRTHDELLGRTALDVTWRAVKEDGTPYAAEDYPSAVVRRTRVAQLNQIMGFPRPDGALVWLSVNALPLFKPSSGRVPIGVVASFSDVTDRKVAVSTLEASEAQFRHLADAIPQQVWTAGRDGALDFVNQRVIDYFARSKEEVLGDGWKAVIHPEDLPLCNARWQHSVATGDDYEVEFRLLRADQAYRWHLARALAIRGPDRSIHKWFGTNTDIDERKKTAEELQRRAEFEKYAVGIVSHDLRSPIGAIKMSASMLLRRGNLDDHQAKGVMRIVSSAERANRMIGGFLDFTQARLGGGIPVTPRLSKLHTVVQSVVDEVQLSHPDRTIRLSVHGDGQGIFDPDRIAQVIGNLVANACQHSPAVAEVRVASFGTETALAVEVANEGSVIPAEFIPGLFLPFKSRRIAPERANGSVGLGLYIAHQLVLAHRGTIEVVSTAETGTTFTVTLPRSPSIASGRLN